jgi:hypothetical protein
MYKFTIGAQEADIAQLEVAFNVPKTVREEVILTDPVNT